MVPDETLDAVSDDQLLADLLEKYRARLLSMLRGRIDGAFGGRIDAEDILSETYLHARRRWNVLRQVAATCAYAWLYRAARDCLATAWRRETQQCRDIHRAMPWPDASSAQLVFGLVGTDTSASRAAARAELEQRLRDALDDLKESDREILWMRHRDELTFADAACVLQISESAVTLRYVRALRRLRESWRRVQPDGTQP